MATRRVSRSGTHHASWCCGWHFCLSHYGQHVGGRLYQPQVKVLNLILANPQSAMVNSPWPDFCYSHLRICANCWIHL